MIDAKANLEKWERRYREGEVPTEPSDFLRTHLHELPRAGAALDLAAGGGRNALALAAHGLSVTALDFSPAALTLIKRRAEKQALTIETVEHDLEAVPAPSGPWDVILCANFLWRPLFRWFPGALRPGGILLFSQPLTTDPHHRTHRFLLAPGELRSLITGLELIHISERRVGDRHLAETLARRPE